MSVSIRAKFRKDDSQYDGLVAVEKSLIEEPLTPHVVVGVIETASFTTDVATGVTTPTVRFRQIEVIGEGAEVIQVTNLLQAAYSRRTGRDDVQPSLFDPDVKESDETWPGDVDHEPAQAADDDSQPASLAERPKRKRSAKPVQGYQAPDAKEEGTSDES